MPVKNAGVRIECIQAVVFGRDDNKIMIAFENSPTENRCIGDVERLRVHLAVNYQIEKQAKSLGIDIRGCQDEFVWIPTSPRVVVVIRQDIGCNATKAANKRDKSIKK